MQLKTGELPSPRDFEGGINGSYLRWSNTNTVKTAMETLSCRSGDIAKSEVEGSTPKVRGFFVLHRWCRRISTVTDERGL